MYLKTFYEIHLRMLNHLLVVPNNDDDDNNNNNNHNTFPNVLREMWGVGEVEYLSVIPLE